MISTQFRMLIDGQLVAGGEGQHFASYNPASEQEWTRIPVATAADTETAIQAAHREFRTGAWSKLRAFERGRMLRRLGELIADNAKFLAEIETADTGKLLKETMRQAQGMARTLDYYGSLADKIQGDTFPSEMPNTFTYTIREPLGVVAGIVPWNSQLPLTMAKLGPALAAGNTIVVKASEHASAPLLALGELIAKSDIPAGVINILSGFGTPTGSHLTTHRYVRRIAFTGGVESARHIVRNSAENLANISLELGGKSAAVLFPDADLDNALNGIVGGIFGASGQSCVAGSRLYVHKSIAETFIARLIERVGKVVVGDPLDAKSQMGPLATRRQLDLIGSTLAHSKQQGARVLAGGGRPAHLKNGWYFEPTIVKCLDNKTDVMMRELFGPVLAIGEFSTESEAIELANDSEYGLAFAVYTRDVGRAIRMSRAIDCGVVWVNTHRTIAPNVDFGGTKNSGYGREGGLQAVYDYTQSKLVWMNTNEAPLPDPLQ